MSPNCPFIFGCAHGPSNVVWHCLKHVRLVLDHILCTLHTAGLIFSEFPSIPLTVLDRLTSQLCVDMVIMCQMIGGRVPLMEHL
jgi:hypothetical protein